MASDGLSPRRPISSDVTQITGHDLDYQGAESLIRSDDLSGLLMSQAKDFEATHLTGNSEVTIDSETSRYVRTDDFDEAADTLTDRKRVVLCGPPGSGKTIVSHALLRRCRDEGFKPYIFSDVKDWHAHIAEGERSVVLMDGTLGEVRVDAQQYRQWRFVLNNLLELTDQGHCRLVITLYPHILRELRELEGQTSSPLLDDLVVIQLAKHSMSKDVRKRLLDFHLQKLQVDSFTQSSLVEKILQKDVSGPVFPWCCRHMVDHWEVSEDPSTIFTVPAEAYVPLLKRLLRDGQHGDTFAAVLALTMKGLGGFLHDPRRVQTHLHELRFQQYSEYHLAEYADVLKGSVLGTDDYGFASRVLYNATGIALGRAFSIPVLLKVCDADFLVSYVRAKPATNFSVKIGTNVNVREIFMQKVHDNIVDGHLEELCQHPSLSSPEFLEEFEVFCNKEKNRLSCLATAVDRPHGLPLVYWSAWSPSSHLTEWCLKITDRPSFFRRAASSESVLFSAFMCVIFTELEPFGAFKWKAKPFVGELFKAANMDSFLNDPAPISVDFPLPEQRFTDDTKEKYRRLMDRVKSQQLPVELTLQSVSVTGNVVSVNMTRKDWYWTIQVTARLAGESGQHGHSDLHAATTTAGNGRTTRSLISNDVLSAARNNHLLMPFEIAEKIWKEKTGASDYRPQDLHRAIKDGDVESVIVLLSSHATVHDRLINSSTPLHSAAWAGQEEIASLLIRLGASVNARMFVSNNAPLHEPCTAGNLSMVRMLVHKGADVNVHGLGGKTPLHCACVSGDADVVEFLIKHDADVNAKTRDDQSKTALHLACAHDRGDVIRMLLRHNADVRAENKEGMKPIDVARRKGQKGAMELLANLPVPGQRQA